MSEYHRQIVELTGDQLRELLRRREELLVAEERAAVVAAVAEAGAELRGALLLALQPTRIVDA